MRKILCILSLAALLSSCGNKQWEYRTFSINSKYHGDAQSPTFNNPTNSLNDLGKQGWEVIGTYTEVKTCFPNFGNAEYVTGIRTNTATEVVTFVLKRKASSSLSAE